MTKKDETKDETTTGQPATEASSSLVTHRSSSLPTLPSDMAQYAGAGLENVTHEDISVPYVSIIQSNSTVMTQDGFAGKPGDFMHTVSQELFSGREGLDVLIVHFQKFWREVTNEQKPKYIAEHEDDWPVAVDAELNAELRRHVCIDGTHAQRIYRYIALIIGADGRTSPACFTFKGSGIRIARNINAVHRSSMVQFEGPDGPVELVAPTWMTLWRLRTVAKSNDDGNWFAYDPIPQGQLDPTSNTDATVFRAAAELFNAVSGSEYTLAGKEDV